MANLRNAVVVLMALGIMGCHGQLNGVVNQVLNEAKQTAPGGQKLKHWPCGEDNRKPGYTCADVTDPICAWYKDGHHAEVKNFCEACKDLNVEYYTEREGSMPKACP